MGPDLSTMTLDRDMPTLLPLEESAPTGANHPELDAVAAWVKDYLCSPHSELGRNGPVCPFVPKALQKQLLFAAIYEYDTLDIEMVKAILLKEMERFITLDPVSGNEAQFKSLMVLFPNLPPTVAADVIDAAQADLQKHFVPNGLMVGEFHSGPPQKRGLWNTEFRPLRSPVPMLVIRHMVPTDALFLKDSPQLFCEYMKIYGNAVPERFREQLGQAAQRSNTSLAAAGENPQCAPRIVESLAAAAIDYCVHCHDDFPEPIRTPKDFAQALGYPEGRITKTLFVKSRDAERFYLIVCGMDKRIDLRGISAKLGIKRLELASLADLQRHIGYPPTSVTPIAVANIPVFIDETLMQYPTVLTGSGVPRVEIEIAPTDLLSLCKAQTMAMA